jgi:hypothetical protein
VLAALDRIPSADRSETYVVSLWVTDELDGEPIPQVRVGHNTETVAREAIARASSELEARWNFAFYLQDELMFIGGDGSDPDATALRDAWIAEEANTGDPGLDRFVIDGPDLANSLIHLLIRVVQRLHSDGALTAVFGRPIPVLIHELEYYDEILVQNLRANPPETMSGFRAWFDAGLM